jgi:hypothetical protein
MAQEDVQCVVRTPENSVHDATAYSLRVYDAAKTLAAVLTDEGLRKRKAAMRKEFESKFEAAKKTAMRVANAIAARDAPSVGPAPAKLRCGQTVLQFWSGWFKSKPENSSRKIASGKDRPNWYVSLILAGPDYQSICYGGVRVEDHCYYVH